MCRWLAANGLLQQSLESQSLRSQSLGLRASLAWAGGHGGTGGAVNPSMGALAKHPCFAKPPYPHARRPFESESVATEKAVDNAVAVAVAVAFDFRGSPANCQRLAGVGLRDRRAPWMARTSLHGRTCGVSRKPTPASQARRAPRPRLFATMRERSKRPRTTPGLTSPHHHSTPSARSAAAHWPSAKAAARNGLPQSSTACRAYRNWPSPSVRPRCGSGAIRPAAA